MTQRSSRLSRSRPDAERIDRICDDFDRAWRAGAQPKIEELLWQVADSLGDDLLCELIAVEVDLRRERGEMLSPQEYLARFPGKRAIVEKAFAMAPKHGSADAQDSTSSSSASTGNGAPATAPETATAVPSHIDRYRVERVLGSGTFGIVYLAQDPDLGRPVAIKVPRAERIGTASDLERYIEEARHAAQLKHPGIVAVYDVQRDGDVVFVVQEFVAGQSLGECLKKERFAPKRTAQVLAAVAEAVSFAHRQGLVHRDLKPDNIIVDSDGVPHVADFGLALHESMQRRQRGERAGSPAYMSPEQVQGLSHRLDGRSDIWSLGVVLYEMLACCRPFAGDSLKELYEEILERDPRPPRQINPAIPAELERVCLKCLSKRMTDRYSSAADLAGDLRHWESATPSPPAASPLERKSAPGAPERPAEVIPKGLRSFDAEDADFFLELLPGPRDRDGLPETIRFWKNRVERTDPDSTFSVGLIYGPSGCGKSSLVKAGLLPRLDSHVIPVYVEATAADTEVRLLKGLKKRLHGISADGSLPEVFDALRDGRGIAAGKKVLVVLDQFEQWLHAKRGEHETQLVQALRHCDGQHVQCVVMVRDDFWMAATRFMRDLEIRLIEAQNSAAVDLFPIRHAENVLAAFGRAFGVLPDTSADLSKEQKQFLEQAVSGLAQEGKVISVRLALFAEMVKGKAWTPATLQEVGGTEGVGVTFLEETFGAATAPPQHRYHQQAARGVLKVLLPESGSDIKGHMRSQQELLEASGYAARPRDFDDLIQILDCELRLITPTERDEGSRFGVQGSGTASMPSGPADLNPEPRTLTPFFQLTHDYLVHSLRDWLTRKQRETRRGRAELRLADRAALWHAKPENRHLPSWWEYLSIRLLTKPQSWTFPQQRMMSRATRVHGTRFGAALAGVLLIGLVVQQVVSSVRHRNDVARTYTAVQALSTSSGLKVPLAIHNLEELPRELVLAELQKQFAQASPAEKVSLAYGLAAFGEPDAGFLIAQVKEAATAEVDNLVAALGPKDVSLIRQEVVSAETQGNWQLKARLSVLALLLGESARAADMCALRADPIQRTVFIDEAAAWHGDLTELAKKVPSSVDPSLRSALCLALGSVAIGGLGRQDKEAWQPILDEWHRRQPDSGTHSASGWALRAWQLPVPELAQQTMLQTAYDWERTKMGLTMLRIPAGEFVRKDEDVATSSAQKVRLSEFLLADTEVTLALFQQFMEDKEYMGEKPTNWIGADANISTTGAHPVQQASWYHAVMFCNWLSWKEGRRSCYEKTGQKEKFKDYQNNKEVEYDEWKLVDGADGYRLPTEAQWEYACRAGTTTEFAFGDEESRLSRYGVYRSDRTESVGGKLCNGWGLFDMHGNVWEWCQDWYEAYPTGDVHDPGGPAKGSGRVYRGGSWSSTAGLCRSANRLGNEPSLRHGILGLRVARGPSAEPVESGRQ
jgi:serine/threonine protein kinase/formylglycine-generating enzyme required for sulfatase activity